MVKSRQRKQHFAVVPLKSNTHQAICFKSSPGSSEALRTKLKKSTDSTDDRRMLFYAAWRSNNHSCPMQHGKFKINQLSSETSPLRRDMSWLNTFFSCMVMPHNGHPGLHKNQSHRSKSAKRRMRIIMSVPRSLIVLHFAPPKLNIAPEKWWLKVERLLSFREGLF